MSEHIEATAPGCDGDRGFNWAPNKPCHLTIRCRSTLPEYPRGHLGQIAPIRVVPAQTAGPRCLIAFATPIEHNEPHNISALMLQST